MIRLNHFRLVIILVLVLLPPALLSAESTMTVRASELEQVKVASAVFNLKGIADIVDAVNASDQNRIAILYGNNNMRVWADKMEQWLVSLGVETQKIRKQVGVVAEGLLVLELDK